MKTVLIVVVLILLAFRGFSEEQEQQKPAKSGSQKPAYEPLEIREGAGESSYPVAPDAKLPSTEPERESAPATPRLESSSPGLVLPIGILPRGAKSEELWIYTLPQEKLEQKEELRRREIIEEQTRQDRLYKLPEWAVSPEYRKYLLPEPGANPYLSPVGASAEKDFDRLRRENLFFETPVRVPEALDARESEKSLLLPGGISVSPGSSADGGTDIDALAAPSYGPALLQKESSGEMADDARANSLFLSNSKEKKAEDFLDGVTDPLGAKKASERYHDPQTSE